MSLISGSCHVLLAFLETEHAALPSSSAGNISTVIPCNRYISLTRKPHIS